VGTFPKKLLVECGVFLSLEAHRKCQNASCGNVEVGWCVIRNFWGVIPKIDLRRLHVASIHRTSLVEKGIRKLSFNDLGVWSVQSKLLLQGIGEGLRGVLFDPLARRMLPVFSRSHDCP
jgi:hypothetical protein